MKHFGILVSFIMCIAYSVGREPTCSKFDFEEKVLEKMIRIEFEMERFKEHFKELKKQLTTELKDMKSDVERNIVEGENKLTELQTAMEARLEEMEKQYQRVQENITATAAHLIETNTFPMVAFRARSPADMSPRSGDTIIYQTVDANHGGGYDHSTGEFTAPVTGLYSFTVHACIRNGNSLQMSLRKGFTMLSGSLTGDNSYYNCHSVTVNVVVAKNEKIDIYVNDGSEFKDNYPNYFNMFSGYLVHT